MRFYLYVKRFVNPGAEPAGPIGPVKDPETGKRKRFASRDDAADFLDRMLLYPVKGTGYFRQKTDVVADGEYAPPHWSIKEQKTVKPPTIKA